MIGSEGQRRGLGTIGIEIVALLGLLFLVAPVVIIVIVSFGKSEYLVFPPRELSLRWYQKVLDDPKWLAAMWVSVRVAFIASLVSSILVIPASLSLVRGRLRFKGGVYAMLLSPLIVPIVITAIGLYFFVTRFVGTGSIVAMGLGHAVLSIPVVTIIVTAALQGVDENLDHAAHGLGASSLYTLWHITLPLIGPGVMAAFLFAFLMSLDELLIPLFLSGIKVQTLSVKIWQGIQYELSPAIAAVSSLLIGATLVFFGLAGAARRRAKWVTRTRGDAG
jgi:putative spermidine/putrescine transport system permease protein